MKKRLSSTGTAIIKIAYRNLFKHPIRTIFTFLAIMLGVSLFFSVNIATDSLEFSLYKNIDPDKVGDVLLWIYLFKGILMVLSGVSLIVSIIIIKNLMEMTKESQIYELGLLRSLGIFPVFLLLPI